MSESPSKPPALSTIEGAVRLSYVQTMLASIFAASTGGMFLTGYALKLGADNVQIGLLSTVSMLCCGVQLPAAILIERGISRRMLTTVASLISVLGWGGIIVIPFIAASASDDVKVVLLIACIALITLFSYVASSARSSWVGDLLPESFLGTFFGRMTMYAGIIGTLCALVQGRLLDSVQDRGIGIFGLLFAFGMLFGLATVFLFLPQPDIPLVKQEPHNSLLTYVRQTFANKPFMVVMLYALLWSVQTIAGPFSTTYLLRDIGISFLGLGALNMVVSLSVLFTSPFWGRMVDQYGCRPILVLSTAALAPLPLIWIWMTNAQAIYWTIPFLNLLCGFFSAGVSVALSTLVYKVTPSAGRSVQFAIYSIIVTLAVAPLPAIGGYLPEWFSTLWSGIDLRITFYAPIPFMVAAAIIARYIREPNSRRTRELVRNLPGHLRRQSGVDSTV